MGAASGPPRLVEKRRVVPFEADHQGKITNIQNPVCKWCQRAFRNENKKTPKLSKNLKEGQTNLYTEFRMSK